MLSLLAQTPELIDYGYAAQPAMAQPTVSPMMMTLYGIFYFVLVASMIVSMWKIFTKAGKAGWASLIPFYNMYVSLKIAGKPGWWLLLFFVPFVNIVVMVLYIVGLAKSFGKSAAYGIFLLWFLSPIGYLMLGLGKAEYQGGMVTESATA